MYFKYFIDFRLLNPMTLASNFLLAFQAQSVRKHRDSRRSPSSGRSSRRRRSLSAGATPTGPSSRPASGVRPSTSGHSSRRRGRASAPPPSHPAATPPAASPRRVYTTPAIVPAGYDSDSEPEEATAAEPAADVTARGEVEEEHPEQEEKEEAQGGAGDSSDHHGGSVLVEVSSEEVLVVDMSSYSGGVPQDSVTDDGDDQPASKKSRTPDGEVASPAGGLPALPHVDLGSPSPQPLSSMSVDQYPPRLRTQYERLRATNTGK